MFKKVVFALSALVGAVQAHDWAVIVAGSNTYGNYRHQADACHAYQVVHKYGIPDSRVIMMYYDDIANSPENPYKGQIFNAPTAQGTPGVDVYGGCPHNYIGKNVTIANFIAVLTGDASSTGGLPVLQSTAQDRVFINFVDHGGTGIIEMPDGLMTSAQLNGALKTMQTNNMYSKLVFYMEACESGSMFEGLVDPSQNIYVTTASNPSESSWGTYCPPDDMVNGKELNSCLGDLYSVNWLENADSVGKHETLEAQYKLVKTATNKSHVMQYGSMAFTSDPIGDYIGDSPIAIDAKPSNAEIPAPNPAGMVPSRDIPLHLSYYKYLRADKADYQGRMALAQKMQAQIGHQMQMDTVFYKLAQKVSGGAHAKAESVFSARAVGGHCGECCDAGHTAVHDHCGGFSDYSLQYARVVNNACREASTETVVNTIKELCAHN